MLLPANTPRKQAKERIQELCDAIGLDPFAVVAHIAAGNHGKLGMQAAELDARIRLDAAKELCSYLAPKLKSVEVTTDGESVGGILLIPQATSQEDWLKTVEQFRVSDPALTGGNNAMES